MASNKLQSSISTSSFLLIIFFSFYKCPKKPKTALTFASSCYLPVSSPKTSPTQKTSLTHLSSISSSDLLLLFLFMLASTDFLLLLRSSFPLSRSNHPLSNYSIASTNIIAWSHLYHTSYAGWFLQKIKKAAIPGCEKNPLV